MSLLVGVELLEVHVGPLGMFLFRVFVQRIQVAEDEVQLVVLATLVRSKHDGVGCAVVELLLQGRTTLSKSDVYLALIHTSCLQFYQTNTGSS